MMNCLIAVADKNSMYMHQIIAGYTLLSKNGQLSFEIVENKELQREFYHNAIIEVRIEGKRIIYDLTDGYNNFPSFSAFDSVIDNVDYYFKANVREEFHLNFRNKHKIFVLAPRYYVTCKDSWLNRVDFGKIFRNQDSVEVKKMIHTLPLGKNANKNRYVQSFEMLPELRKQPRVFFYTRLWDPSIASAYSSQNVDLDGKELSARIECKKEQYAKVSELRAGLVRALKKEFGDLFIGGVSPTEYARQYYPDLIGDVDMSKRKSFTRHMHMAEICVNTQGTHNCWNFSFGEEIAAARAIVTERPFYKIPDNLKAGRNFLTYSSVEECVESVTYLRSNREVLQTMMVANKHYYDEHLQPDKLVQDTLSIVMR